MGELQTVIFSCSGRRGTGKSTLLAHELREQPRVVVWDPLSEHGGWCPNPLYRPDRLEEFLEWTRNSGGSSPSPRPHRDWLKWLGWPFVDENEESEASESRCPRSRFAARYIPQGDPAEEFEEFCFEIYRRGNLTVAIEEVSLVCSSPSSMPAEFGRLVRLSRHRNINICWTAQRFAEVPRTLTALTDVFAIFQVTEPRDLDALAGRTSLEIADQVAQLDVHEGIMYDVRTREAQRITSEGKVLGPLSNGREGTS